MNNFNNMIKQAQDLQKKMAEAQEKVETLEAEGISGLRYPQLPVFLPFPEPQPFFFASLGPA